MKKPMFFVRIMVLFIISGCFVTIGLADEMKIKYSENFGGHTIRYYGNSETLLLPAEYEGERIRRICWLLYLGEEKSQTKKIIIPEGVEVLESCDGQDDFDNLEEIMIDLPLLILCSINS